jgi:16S rRNA pseudouridine516 synthase
MRLDKYIASLSELSRKRARLAIRAGQVCVDGVVRTDYDGQIAPGSSVTLDGVALRPAGLRYFMLHKPLGVICANRDSHHRTVIDLITVPDSDSLQIVGRLDIDTTGLVLLTDDGQWNHRLTSPRKACSKEYQVGTEHPIEPATTDVFARGMLLQPENRLTRPATLQIRDAHRAQLCISEGMYHQVKRMFAHAGNTVTSLHRSAIGAIRLDENLPAGQFRALTRAEIESVE